ncbi:phage tail tape measure protein [Caviibacterium pharyngocola]|uniref:Phage tail tape measure protein domain-containing protein n=1 Tax=Caviibacterium pharyngocola TaxID=28159 RepID=A0A2M8RY09_9PAST|nr:phage tail tape measure protein [Caviibacterium pharyngocola]PJG83765.1 hypothetical protein CVP04_01345 [Caviibacterium pharyngocola]
MGSKFELEMILQAKDYASKVIKEVANRTKKSTQDVENQTKKSVQTQQRETQKTARITEQSYRQISQIARQAAGARESLGIRSERSIQREIQRTRLEYERLKSSGMASSRELSRAYDAMQNRVRALNAEMGKLSAGQKMMNVGYGVAGVATGVSVAAGLAARPIKTTADYNLQLAYLANTAYSDRDKEGKKAGMDNIHQVIKSSITQYGGSQEDALNALGEIISKGRVSVDDALALLPDIQKNAIATGASTIDIAQLVNAGLGYGIRKEEIQDFLDYANTAGKAGGFELRDMAKYAPALFANASGAGLKGMSGAKEMFKMLQQVYNVSGGSSETATNVMNFLSKLNSQDTIKRAAKIELTHKGKTYGLDLKKSMTDYLAQGKNTVEAFLTIVDDILANDKEYQTLQKKLAKAQGNAEKYAIIDSIANYLEGTKVGELVADKQAWLGMYGIRSQQQTAQNVENAYQTAKGETDRDSEFIQEQAATKFQRAGNVAEMSKAEAFKDVTEWSADIAEKMAEYGAQYPALTTALTGAVESIKILGGAAIAAAGSLALFGFMHKGRTGVDIDDLMESGNKKSPKTGGRSSKMSGRFGKTVGFLAKASIVGEALFHSEELNKGEDEQLEIMRRISDGSATPEQKALSDAGYSASKADAEVRRQRREQHEKENGFTPLNDDEQRRYQQALTAQLQHNTQRQFEQATSVLNGWFSSKAEKANAMKRLDSLDSNLLSDTQRKEIDSIKLKEQQDKVNQARSVVNGFGFLTASEEEKAEAKAVLEQQNKLTEKIPTNAVNNTNIQLPSDDKKAFLDSQIKFSEDIQSLGVSIQEGFKRAIALQDHTIKNLITVELDGRVIAEQTSEYQYREMVRG